MKSKSAKVANWGFRSKRYYQAHQAFTIVEVMIVLAIAGLIITIVFLAVPQLQRNSRNAQRKNDVASLLAGVNEYATNHNGTLPTDCSGSAGQVSFGTGTDVTQSKVGLYTAGCSQIALGNDASSGASAKVYLLQEYKPTGSTFGDSNHDYVAIVPGAKCSTSPSGQTIGGFAKQYVAIYELEGGGSNYSPACEQNS